MELHDSLENAILGARRLRAENDRLRMALGHVVILIEAGTPLEAMNAALNALDGE